MYGDYAIIFLFFIIAIAFVGISLGIGSLLRPNRIEGDKLKTYECGPLPIGEGHARFNFRFFTFIVFFILFEIEIVFMIPWAVAAKGYGKFAIVEGLIFIGILLAGLGFVWFKNDLEWIKEVKDLAKNE